MKTIGLLVIIISVIYLSAVTYAGAITDPCVAIDKMNRRDATRFEQEQQDRQSAKKAQAAENEAAKERSTAAAYRESRNARIKKVERSRGKKAKSWQVLNR